VILLDLEMEGLDGIAVCLQLKEDFSLQDIPVIFISSHDDLETRLKAYASGAEDYIVKPIHAEELLSKVKVVSRMLEQRRELSNRSSDAQKAAFAAMISMGEMGTVMEFMRATFACHSTAALLDSIAAYYAQAGLSGGAQIRGDEGILSRLIGDAAPLTSSVLDGIRNVGRIFEFKNRMAINYPQVSLLISDLPTDDADRCGRIRDNFALVAEAAEIRLASIDAANRLQNAGTGAGEAVSLAAATANRYVAEARLYRASVSSLMSDLVTEFERSFVYMGLKESQEALLVDMVKQASSNVLAAAAPLQAFEGDFEVVVQKLAAVAKLTATAEHAP
jgi:CheY-like chemotaxis protein